MEQGVGKTLRAARRRRAAELADVEATTRIRARFLRALENEEWDVLPGEAYTRGFIRTYADYLGLDGARLAEEHRHAVGADRPGERLLGGDPMRAAAPKPTRRPRFAPRILMLLVTAVLVAVLIAAGLSGGGGESSEPRKHSPTAGQVVGGTPSPGPKPKRGLSLRLTATAEVWVCLLNAGGQPLVEGQILSPGAEAGPFRSGSFTVSLGNGEVSMTVNGRQASIPATPSPIGYSIGAGGSMRKLSAGERPTCT
jgi:cytoskeleton protein RodZ